MTGVSASGLSLRGFAPPPMPYRPVDRLSLSLPNCPDVSHAQSCTGCLASPQFVRSRNRSGEPRHDHPHELASMPMRVREQCQSPADADKTPHCLQMHRAVCGTQPPMPHSITQWPELSEQETSDRGSNHLSDGAVRDPKRPSPCTRLACFVFASLALRSLLFIEALDQINPALR